MASSGVSSTIFFDQIKKRHSYYALSKDLPISKDKVQEIVKDVLLHVPSALNMQHVRAVVLFGTEHDKLWDITGEVLRAKIGDERYKAGTEAKMAMFKGAAGTVSSLVLLYSLLYFIGFTNTFGRFSSSRTSRLWTQ